MSTKELILIILAIIVAGCIIAIGVYTGLTHETQAENNTIANNTTNITNVANNTTSNDTVSKESTNNYQSSSSNNYQSSSSSSQQSSSADDESHYVYYEGEKIDTSVPGQFEGATQEEVDNYHPEL